MLFVMVLIGTLTSTMTCFKTFYFVCKSFRLQSFYERELYVFPFKKEKRKSINAYN
jgi:hypothetical protein